MRRRGAARAVRATLGSLAAFTVGCSPLVRSARPTMRVTTQVLRSPEDTASVLEPFVAIDADRPDRIIIGAQYGTGYNRGGARFWSWISADGGATWRGARMVPPAAAREQVFAADVVLAAGDGGEIFHLGLSGGAGTSGTAVPDAALRLATSGDWGTTWAARAELAGIERQSPSLLTAADKPWMALDRNARSPHRGSLYVAWARQVVRFEPRGTSVTPQMVLRRSRDGGRTFDEPRMLADTGFSAQLAVRPSGSLDVLWYRPRAGRGGDDRVDLLLHIASHDGGTTFSTRDTVATVPDGGQSLDAPSLGVSPAGSLLACWVRGAVSSSDGTAIWCAMSSDGTSWTLPSRVSTTSRPDVVYGYPAVAFAAGAWWLLAYESDTSATRVLLLRSRDGQSFVAGDTLAVRPLPLSHFCPRPGLPCRRDPRMFIPGDYVSLAAAGDRLVAAFALPARGGAAIDRAELSASVIDLGKSRAGTRRHE